MTELRGEPRWEGLTEVEPRGGQGGEVVAGAPLAAGGGGGAELECSGDVAHFFLYSSLSPTACSF
jgi:hypothetical protein